MIYFEGKHWVILEDAPQYCELNWEILLKKLREELPPDEPMIKLKKVPQAKVEMSIIPEPKEQSPQP